MTQLKTFFQKTGKYLFLTPFVIFGIMHFINEPALSTMVPNWIPGDMFIVYFTGAALIAAPIAVIINKYASLAMFLLGILMLLTAFTVHLAAVIGGDQMAMANVLKDVALAGAAFLMSKE